VDWFDRHSRDYRIDHHRVRFDIRLLGNWVGAIHVSPIRETCGRSTNQREAPRLVQGQEPRPDRRTRPSSPRVAMPGGTEVSVLLKRLYLPSGDFAEPAYAARTSHWAASLKRGAGLRVAPSALGIAGTTLIGPAASSGPFAGAVRGRQRVQAQQFRHRSRARAPGAPKAKHQRDI
jgi:hypothetical protein